MRSLRRFQFNSLRLGHLSVPKAFVDFAMTRLRASFAKLNTSCALSDCTAGWKNVCRTSWIRKPLLHS
ncbi:hypothetical protein GCM10027431_07840 [Lysobacter rhizosphaerae]